MEDLGEYIFISDLPALRVGALRKWAQDRHIFLEAEGGGLESFRAWEESLKVLKPSEERAMHLEEEVPTRGEKVAMLSWKESNGKYHLLQNFIMEKAPKSEGRVNERDVAKS